MPAAESDDSAPQTVLLDVRFPNGYEAAAKAVIALAGDGGQGPPSWSSTGRPSCAAR